MKHLNKPQVIAIAAVSGGGKTTVVNALRDKLNDTKVLYFDDYEFEDAPQDICQWVEDGADYNLWNLGPLIRDLQSLLSHSQEPLEYILLDYPFAYRHQERAKFIDHAIYIDTPLDIAQGRRLLRDFAAGEVAEDIRNDLKFYLERGRQAYLEMITTIKPDSDYVVDGTLPVPAITELLVSRILQGGE
ncbi:hypothetical protein [Paenibacillus donghaensis]|uniref:Phosphoribulokinase/uridine kinase domain-containing protein n=1 Tax=Paenibacillus donghaensis TaxID=414771 RepID=A0A2Z2KI47_9BACL|nr:hypothetical protein [Paenibacillus donghaensis]ASA21879.1 hypothetical protein B9T62_14500 [Paenibacillus donghaensis]